MRMLKALPTEADSILLFNFNFKTSVLPACLTLTDAQTTS